MDYYCFGDDVNIYMNILIFFVSICLNDIHYYVLLQWAPALMSISSSAVVACIVFVLINSLLLSPVHTADATQLDS